MKKIKDYQFVKYCAIIISIIGFLATLYFSFEYIDAFSEQRFSDDPKAWTDTANYFSGLLTPVFTLVSTLLLAYISLKLGKDATEESKKLFILEQKIAIYQDICNSKEELINSISYLLLLINNPSFIQKYESKDLIILMTDLLKNWGRLILKLDDLTIHHDYLFNYDFENAKWYKIRKKLIKQQRQLLKAGEEIPTDIDKDIFEDLNIELGKIKNELY